MSVYSGRLARAARVLREGGLVAYPTESCYGLGCDPMNARAVRRLLRLKRRPLKKGLILIAASFEQLRPYVAHVSEEILAGWPGARTWLLPATPHTPVWILGWHPRVAVRVSAHPVAAALCRAAGMAIVSTSANPAGQRPARSLREVHRRFGRHIDYVLPGRIGRRRRPTPIVDAVTRDIVRKG